MSTKDTTLIDADSTDDDSDEQSSNEQPMSEDSDDEESIPEDSANFDEETSENSASEDDESIPGDSEGESEPDADPELEAEVEADRKKKPIRYVPRPRKESQITDFREGYVEPSKFVRTEWAPKRQDKRLDDEISKIVLEDTGFRFGDEHIKDENYVDPNKTYLGFKRMYFSKEMVEHREQSILKGFEWNPDHWFDYPVDPEGWTEKDNREVWSDRPLKAALPGFDPKWPDEEDVDEVEKSIEMGIFPTFGPFYVPYRKHDPLLTAFHYAVNSPKNVIEELDKIEEFMKWVSYVFLDGSSYEGTVWDDVAQGKGVYISPQGLVRYEGEWFRNYMEGHGVTEVEIPDYQPVPGSPYEAEMREKGEIITRDFMSPDDREWLEMDIKDGVNFSGRKYTVPFYENDLWLKLFNGKPEKGRYRYAGQWKHGRMHGCGVYEVNERVMHGRFYFGEFTGSTAGCDSNVSALHAGIAEVAAAKARMFMNKPDGMVREDAGPFNDPQHPYYYEEDDAWMAPGFVHQFYEVPDYWKAYAEDVDEEREMWLNSFYKAPLRLPMPAELEHWWSKDEAPEFILVKGEPEPDPEDPSKLIDPDPLILHTPTKRLISYVDDEEHGVRLYWLPHDGEMEKELEQEELEEVEVEVEGNLKKVKFLPHGFDKFQERYAAVEDRNPVLTVILGVCKSAERWIKKKKKASNKRKKKVEEKLDLIEAEITLKESIEDADEVLLRLQKEELKKMKEGLIEEEDIIIPPEETSQLDEEDSDVKGEVKEEKEAKNEEKEESEDSEEEEDDEVVPASFGSIIDEQDSTKSDRDGKKNGRSPFASLSLPFASLVLVPSQLQLSFSKWRESKLPPKIAPPTPSSSPSPSRSCIVSPDPQMSICSVSFPRSVDQSLTLRAGRHAHHQGKRVTRTRMRSHTSHKASAELHRKTADGSWIWPATDQGEKLNILSLHTVL